MKIFFAQNKIFLLLHAAFLMAGAVVILMYERGDEIIYIHNLHTPLLNSFFSAFTKLAEAPIFVLMILVAATTGLGKGLVLLLTYLVNGIITQFLKIHVFANEARPLSFFQDKINLTPVPGVENLHDNSLPSGHTSTAFAIFFMLSMFSKNKNWSYVYFLLALLVGVSRVYLLQHFFRDVYFGSLLGVMVAALVFLFFVESKFYHSLSWRNKKFTRQ